MLRQQREKKGDAEAIALKNLFCLVAVHSAALFALVLRHFRTSFLFYR